MNRVSTAVRRKRKEFLLGWLLLLPAIGVMLVFTVYPVLRSGYLSLTKYKMGMDRPEWIAFGNYTRLFGSTLFWKGNMIPSLVSINPISERVMKFGIISTSLGIMICIKMITNTRALPR